MANPGSPGKWPLTWREGGILFYMFSVSIQKPKVWRKAVISYIVVG